MNSITVDILYASLSESMGVALIDVRTPDEFAKGHARGFINIPLATITTDTANIPSADTIYFMCGSGGRSATATKFALVSGLNAINVDGGFSAWKEASLPVE